MIKKYSLETFECGKWYRNQDFLIKFNSIDRSSANRCGSYLVSYEDIFGFKYENIRVSSSYFNNNFKLIEQPKVNIAKLEVDMFIKFNKHTKVLHKVLNIDDCVITFSNHKQVSTLHPSAQKWLEASEEEIKAVQLEIDDHPFIGMQINLDRSTATILKIQTSEIRHCYNVTCIDNDGNIVQRAMKDISLSIANAIKK